MVTRSKRLFVRNNWKSVVFAAFDSLLVAQTTNLLRICCTPCCDTNPRQSKWLSKALWRSTNDTFRCPEFGGNNRAQSSVVCERPWQRVAQRFLITCIQYDSQTGKQASKQTQALIFGRQIATKHNIYE